MKWFALLLCILISVLFSACEKHDASELKQIEGHEEGAHAEHAAEPTKPAPEKK